MAGRNRAKVDQAGGRIAGTSITGTYQAVLSSVPGRGVIISIANSCDQELVVSLDGGTTNWMNFPVGYSPVLDFGCNGIEFSGTVSVKHNGVGPSQGAFCVSVVRSE